MARLRRRDGRGCSVIGPSGRVYECEAGRDFEVHEADLGVLLEMHRAPPVDGRRLDDAPGLFERVDGPAAPRPSPPRPTAGRTHAIPEPIQRDPSEAEVGNWPSVIIEEPVLEEALDFTEAAVEPLPDEEPDDEAVVEKATGSRCVATTTRGTRCRLPAAPDSEFCHLHYQEGR